jgi:hypothetical protein
VRGTYELMQGGFIRCVVQTRVKTAVPPLIAKEYYPVAQRELRTVVGYLRFDLKELAELSSNKKANLAIVNTAKADVRSLCPLPRDCNRTAIGRLPDASPTPVLSRWGQ